ncbi:MAG: hypothetical protein JEZ07_00685 [Phycisphaerae bacterium]|nr:hypothetical protein [Phycisphaerae bacterium]
MMEDFRQLHVDVAFGRSKGKIIWQPRITCWYNDKYFNNETLPDGYEGLSFYDIYRKLGCSARLYDFNDCFIRNEEPRVREYIEDLGNNRQKRTIETPVGRQIEILQKSNHNPESIRIKWEVETEDELKVALWREENATWQWDQQKYDKLYAELCDLGAPTIFMPRMNVQNLYIEKMGIEKGIYALYDWPDTIEAYFKARSLSHDILIKLINDSPIEIINFGENIHSATLTPRLFKKYHLPECQSRCEKLHAANKFVCSHWDGNCQGLLQYAGDTGLDGIEAITPKPQGDVTLEEIKEALGEEMFLLDGIPAVYFDKTYSEEILINCVHKLIGLFAPKLILGISDEISSTGDIERVRIVKEIVDEYNRKQLC